MTLPNRTFGASYHYGFNGKDKDGDGSSIQYDYGFRIYDTHLGRFKSVDPIIKQYPELTPYQFASNRPIDGIDRDGLEWMKCIPKFKYNGTLSNNPVENIPNAIGNGGIDLLNIMPSTWNSGVDAVSNLYQGHFFNSLGNDLRSIHDITATTVYNSINYTINTPLRAI